MKTTFRKIGVAIVAVALMALPVAVIPGPASAAGAPAFGAPFMLKNPALNNTLIFGVQDVEPSIRVDTLGNAFPGAIRGVPAGVDVWRVSTPYGSSNVTYLGQPDGTPPITGPGPGNDIEPGVGSGGGDIDLASSCDTNLLNVSSLNLATTENFLSADQGNHFDQTVPSSSTYSGVVDRQW